VTHETQLDFAYHWEKTQPDKVWLTQPMGGGAMRELTWKQGLDEARRMARHLDSLGYPKGSQIALFAKNNAWWILADLAIWMAGHVSVPLYPTLTAETIRQIIDHSEAKLIFVGKLDGFAEMEPGIPKDMPRIALPLAPKQDCPQWDDLVKKTEPIEGSPKRNPDDLATLIYTSGSTGVPKGVMHSFRTMTSSGVGVTKMLHCNADDRMLSYLPLAHAFERFIVETGTFAAGYSLWFAESLDTFVADLRRAKPTLFVSVPRLWSKFQSGVFQKMPPGRLDFMLKVPILSGFIGKKVLTGLGLENVRFAGSGSAPIPAELIAWYRRLGLELLEGYGMSENFSYSHVTRPGEPRVGFVGRPYDECEQRISESGEIEVKSPGTMLGYFKAPELTAEVMTKDGFLKTGDQGVIVDGQLKITGRVKELFKSSKGKYIAPAPIENKLLEHHDIEQCCVSGHSQPQPYAMVLLSPIAKTEAATAEGKARITAALGKLQDDINATLNQHEQLEKVVIISDDWTIENGLLTPTMKLKRNVVEKKYADKVEGWYASKSSVIWA